MIAAVAFAAAALAVWSAAELVGAVAVAARPRLPAAAERLATLVAAIARAGRDGRDPGAAERRRLLVAGGALAFAVATALVGPVVGLAAAAAGPWGTAWLLRVRRARYRRAVDAGAGELAVALADALGAGHSLRGALAEATRSVGGRTGVELARTTAELAAGARTDAALAALAERTRSRRLAVVVAACLVQRGAGGDLARLLRECAAGFADEARLADEVRAATAQARFTGFVVIALPLGGAALTELASPGFVAGLLGSLLTAWLVGLAVALQVAAAVAIRRLGTVRW